MKEYEFGKVAPNTNAERNKKKKKVKMRNNKHRDQANKTVKSNMRSR